MPTEEQGSVLGDKNQSKKGIAEKRCCFCLAFGPKINIFPYLTSWIYQEVVNRASHRIGKKSREDR